MIKRAYKKLKNYPILGKILGYLRKSIYVRIIQKPKLKKRDFAEAIKVLKTVFGLDTQEALKYLAELRRNKIFKQKFSFGHSDDFDVMILYSFIRMTKPDIVVETGVASGRSTAIMLQALNENNKGMLYSIDLPKFYRGRKPSTYKDQGGKEEFGGFIPKGKKPGWLIPEHLRNRWQLILGDSRVELPKLAKKLKRINIFYHDSDHSYETMMFEYRTVWPFIIEGGFLFSDDIKRNNAFNNFVKSVQPDFVHKYRGMGIIRK